MKATDTQVRAWKTSGKQYQVTAAAIALWAAGQESGTALPGDYVVTRDLGIEPSTATIQRAKRFLAANGILRAGDGHYRVA
jgi:hypothetical protein